MSPISGSPTELGSQLVKDMERDPPAKWLERVIELKVWVIY